MSRAVRFDEYGDAGVLEVRDVERPVPHPDQVLVEVVAAGINPGEIAIRSGALHEPWPATFPSGEGTDFAGRVVAAGAEVTGFAPGDEVLGWSDWRSSHAEHVVVPPDHLTPKPLALDWIRAGGLFVAGVTAFAAVRRGHAQARRDRGGQRRGRRRRRARRPARPQRRRQGHRHRRRGQRGLVALGRGHPGRHGDGLADRLRAVAGDGIDAFVDTYGNGYVDLAVELGVDPARIDTIIDFAAAQKTGAKADGSSNASSADILAYVAEQVAWGRIVLPIAAVYPLEDIRAAYTELGRRHTRGKIVLAMGLPADAGRQGPTD